MKKVYIKEKRLKAFGIMLIYFFISLITIFFIIAMVHLKVYFLLKGIGGHLSRLFVISICLVCILTSGFYLLKFLHRKPILVMEKEGIKVLDVFLHWSEIKSFDIVKFWFLPKGVIGVNFYDVDKIKNKFPPIWRLGMKFHSFLGYPPILLHLDTASKKYSLIYPNLLIRLDEYRNSVEQKNKHSY